MRWSKHEMETKSRNGHAMEYATLFVNKLKIANPFNAI